MTITHPSWLIPAYIFNVLILIPVCYTLFFGGGMAQVFEDKVSDSDGLGLATQAPFNLVIEARR
jgi:hypothetical protein